MNRREHIVLANKSAHSVKAIEQKFHKKEDLFKIFTSWNTHFPGFKNPYVLQVGDIITKDKNL